MNYLFIEHFTAIYAALVDLQTFESGTITWHYNYYNVPDYGTFSQL